MENAKEIETPMYLREAMQRLGKGLGKDATAGFVFSTILCVFSALGSRDATVAKDEFFHHLFYIHPMLLLVGMLLIATLVAFKGLVVGVEKEIKLGEISDEYLSKPALYILSHLSGVALGAAVVAFIDFALSRYSSTAFCSSAVAAIGGFFILLLFATLMRLGVIMAENPNRMKQLSLRQQFAYLILGMMPVFFIWQSWNVGTSTENQYNNLAHGSASYICKAH